MCVCVQMADRVCVCVQTVDLCAYVCGEKVGGGECHKPERERGQRWMEKRERSGGKPQLSALAVSDSGGDKREKQGGIKQGQRKKGEGPGGSLCRA